MVSRTNTEVGTLLQLSDVQAKFRGLGIQIVGGSADQFASFMRSEGAKWGKIVRDSGAKVD